MRLRPYIKKLSEKVATPIFWNIIHNQEVLCKEAEIGKEKFSGSTHLGTWGLTNEGREFLKILDESFPERHPLRKIMNRNTVKVSYSTTPNIDKFISGRNAKLLASEKQVQEKTCSCRKNATCPLDGKCLEENIVYHAEVSQLGNTTRNYVGLCSTNLD